MVYKESFAKSSVWCTFLITTCGELPSGFQLYRLTMSHNVQFSYMLPDGDLFDNLGHPRILRGKFTAWVIWIYRLVDSIFFLVIDQRLTYCHREKNEKPLGHREFFDGSLGMPTKKHMLFYLTEKGGKYDWGIPAFLPAHSLWIRYTIYILIYFLQ